MRELLFNAPAALRPAIVGKNTRDGTALVSALGELRPSRLIELVAHWLDAHFPKNAILNEHLRHVRDFTPPELLSNAGDAVKRVPYFCAGCPPQHQHQSARRFERARRHRLPLHGELDGPQHRRADPDGRRGRRLGLRTRCSPKPRTFSKTWATALTTTPGYLAIRQAVAAKATLTYKILFNDAVAMTGGQPVDGIISVDAIARQVESEGREAGRRRQRRHRQVRQHQRPISGRHRIHDRSELDAVQRRLREIAGVTVLIYEQTCAAEKRRRRKKGELADPPKRLFINEAVCEGCGDCSVQSNCVAVLPHETTFGRKRRIDQTGCNKDYSCAKGFCPSFVGVSGGGLRKKSGVLSSAKDAFIAKVDALPAPTPHIWTGPWDLLVTGVGGTGVVTVGAVIAMAAHLEGKAASVLDFRALRRRAARY